MRRMPREKTLATAAAQAGMTEKTARKYRDLGQLPSQGRVLHDWKTREDAVAPAYPFCLSLPWLTCFGGASFPGIASRLRCVGRYHTPSAAVGVIGGVFHRVLDNTSSFRPALSVRRALDSVLTYTLPSATNGDAHHVLASSGCTQQRSPVAASKQWALPVKSTMYSNPSTMAGVARVRSTRVESHTFSPVAAAEEDQRAPVDHARDGRRPVAVERPFAPPLLVQRHQTARLFVEHDQRRVIQQKVFVLFLPFLRGLTCFIAPEGEGERGNRHGLSSGDDASL